MIHLASDIPAELIREPGYANWIVYALLTLFIAREIRAWVSPEKREISGTVGTKPVTVNADKADVDFLTATVGAMREENARQNTAMREEITAQFRAAQTHGENRVVAITADINAEMHTLGGNMGKLAEALHEKINGVALQGAAHGEAIGNLKAADYRHDGQVAAIQRHIDELKSAGSKPKH